MSFVKSAGIVRKAEDSVFLTFLFVRKKLLTCQLSFRKDFLTWYYEL
ncbi:Uncharacterised protein [Bacteroides thetaiotaomicron]|nr:Uncharacterised protein [Bacteroides thetaiotaomicron]